MATIKQTNFRLPRVMAQEELQHIAELQLDIEEARENGNIDLSEELEFELDNLLNS